MNSGVSPKINLFERMEFSKIDAPGTMPSMRMDDVERPESTNFQSVLTDLVENLNTQVNAPDELTKDLMMGKADVHDVMAAVAKSEINVNIATTVVGKVIQTYEKIMQIQI